jgi:hypothetical protein
MAHMTKVSRHRAEGGREKARRLRVAESTSKAPANADQMQDGSMTVAAQMREEEKRKEEKRREYTTSPYPLRGCGGGQEPVPPTSLGPTPRSTSTPPQPLTSGFTFKAVVILSQGPKRGRIWGVMRHIAIPRRFHIEDPICFCPQKLRRLLEPFAAQPDPFLSAPKAVVTYRHRANLGPVLSHLLEHSCHDCPVAVASIIFAPLRRCEVLRS